MELEVIAVFNIITAVFLDVTAHRPVDSLRRFGETFSNDSQVTEWDFMILPLVIVHLGSEVIKYINECANYLVIISSLLLYRIYDVNQNNYHVIDKVYWEDDERKNDKTVSDCQNWRYKGKKVTEKMVS
jgi:hypothetical protein